MFGYYMEVEEAEVSCDLRASIIRPDGNNSTGFGQLSIELQLKSTRLTRIMGKLESVQKR